MTLTESGAAAAESAASEGASRRRNRGGEGVVGRDPVFSEATGPF